MATSTGWTDFAILEPSTPQFNKKGEPVKWRVQRNGEGAWRCYCPAYIFSKGFPKSCKHIRKCQEVLSTEVTETIKAPVTPKVAVPRWVTEAQAATTAMLRAARIQATETQTAQMIEVLSARLRAWSPGPVKADPVVTQAATVVVGVRHITFED